MLDQMLNCSVRRMPIDHHRHQIDGIGFIILVEYFRIPIVIQLQI